MYVDCETCPRSTPQGHRADDHCASCVVGFFMDRSAVAPLDRREAEAVNMFVDLGMVTPAEASRAHAIREPLPVVSSLVS